MKTTLTSQLSYYTKLIILGINECFYELDDILMMQIFHDEHFQKVFL